MNALLSNSVRSPYTSPFDVTAPSQTKSNGKQSTPIADNDNNVFQKNLEQFQQYTSQGQTKEPEKTQNYSSYTILDDSLAGVDNSAPPEKIDSHEAYIEKTMENIRNGESIVDAMMKAKSEVFELLLEEELELNGNNVKEAAKDAKINLKMEISDQDMLGVMRDMIQELKNKPNKTPEEEILMNDLGEFSSELAEKIRAEEGRENLEDEIQLDAKSERINSSNIAKTDSLANASPLQAKNANAHANKELIHLLNENYLDNKSATSKNYNYESVDIVI